MAKKLDLSEEAASTRHARSQFNSVDKPTAAQQKAYDAMEKAQADAAAALKESREAFLATLKEKK